MDDYCLERNITVPDFVYDYEKKHNTNVNKFIFVTNDFYRFVKKRD